jgi:hypothetical protein
MSPLVPTALDGTLMIASLVALLLTIAAFISLVRTTPPSGLHLLAWSLVVLLVPFFGPAAWFTAQHGKRSFELKRTSDRT